MVRKAVHASVAASAIGAVITIGAKNREAAMQYAHGAGEKRFVTNGTAARARGAVKCATLSMNGDTFPERAILSALSAGK